MIGEPSSRPCGCIDVHHHHGTPEFAQFMADTPSDRIFPPNTWRVEEALADMDESGVRTAILSQFPPYHLATAARRKALARDLNEAAARHATDHPGRFGLFTSLPLPSIDDCLEEIEYGFDVLGADGVAISTSIDGKWLGDPYFTPLWEELNRRKAVVYTHPYTPACCCGLVPEIPEYIIEYATDTTRTIGSLIWSGTTERFPDIKFIFSHGGGTMPFLIERFLAGTAVEVVPGITTKGKSPPFVPPQPSKGILHELRRMYYDTAQCSNPIALRALRDTVLPSQILFGSDYWYRTSVETVRGLDSAQVFTGPELEMVKNRNASRLFESWPGSEILSKMAARTAP
ncbi:amidohydrolase family protein [Sphingobium sp.]|uniref:amidohydrolase family protein n=1 Tax=Sphingobium sp. TaxID=1912891 RepID=UPI0028BEE3CC|nr:amidohydrolase family protein [Sphingobium sp.]